MDGLRRLIGKMVTPRDVVAQDSPDEVQGEYTVKIDRSYGGDFWAVSVSDPAGRSITVPGLFETLWGARRAARKAIERDKKGELHFKVRA